MPRRVLLVLALCAVLPAAEWWIESARGFCFPEGEAPSVTVGGIAAGGALGWRISDHTGAPFAAGDAVLAQRQLVLPALPRGLYRLQLSDPQGAPRAECRFAVILAGPAPDPAGPWGMMVIPDTRDRGPERAAAIARNLRDLGVGSVRLNFWLWAFQDIRLDGADGAIEIDYHPSYRHLVAALQAEGIAVMGGFCQMPAVLSSSQDQSRSQQDGSTVSSHHPPADWDQWRRFVTRVVRDFEDGIQDWEVWNEPNSGHNFWNGGPEAFARLVAETAAGIAAVDPAKRVVVAGFTRFAAGEDGGGFLRRILELGAGPHIDVLSIHNNDPGFRELLAEFRDDAAAVPLWHTENKPIADVRLWLAGHQRVMHFFHSGADQGGFSTYQILCDPQLQPRPWAVTYATAARVIADRPLLDHRLGDGCQVGVWGGADGTQVALFKREGHGLLGGSVSLEIAGDGAGLLDHLGRGQPLAAGRHRLELADRHQFVRGASAIAIIELEAPHERPDPEQVVVLVDDPAASLGPGWELRSPAGLPSPAGRIEHDRVAWLYRQEPPADGAYWLELPLRAPRAGRYRLLLMGATSDALRSDVRWLSPFRWRVDESAWTTVAGTLPRWTWRRSNTYGIKNEPVPDDVRYLRGGPGVYQELAVLDLDAGTSTWRLEVATPRPQGEAFATWIEGLVLRPVAPQAADRAQVDRGELPAAIPLPLGDPGFEAGPIAGRRGAPPPWRSELGNDLYVGAYPARAGQLATQLWAAPGGRQDLAQRIPATQVAAALGRAPRAGDRLRLRAWLRFYWEEAGVPPASAALVLTRGVEPGIDVGGRRFALPPLTRSWTRYQAELVLDEALLAQPGDWLVGLDMSGGAEGVGRLLVDEVTLELIPAPAP